MESKSIELLTPHEKEVVGMLAEGLAPKAIAHLTGLSLRTIHSHRGNAMRKLDLHNVVGLVMYALKNKLAPLPG